MSYQNNDASAANYVKSLQSGNSGAPSYRVAPAPAYVPDPYLQTNQGGYSPAVAEPVAGKSGFAYDEYSNDPNAPQWLKNNPQAPPPPTYMQSKAGGDPEQQIEHNHRPDTCCAKCGHKFLSCIVYFFGIISAIICIVVEKKNAYLLANAWQCLFVSIPCIIICLFFAWTSIGSAILWSAYWLVCLALIVATLCTPYPYIFPVPILGNWAVKRAEYTVSHHHTVVHHSHVSETTTIRTSEPYGRV